MRQTFNTRGNPGPVGPALVVLSFVATRDTHLKHITLNSSRRMLIGVDKENLLKKLWLNCVMTFLIDDTSTLCQIGIFLCFGW